MTANISAAIAEALCVPAISALLANSSAEIRQQTLDKIIENGSRIKEWHLPLVLRSELSQRAIRRLAGFVGAALLDRLTLRHGLDEDTRDYLAKKVREQLDLGGMEDTTASLSGAADEVRRLFQSGNLTDAVIESAAEAGRRDFIVAAFSRMAKVPVETVRRMLDAQSAKPITALVWRAGLGMRASFKIQTFVMRLPANELLPARGGVHFPLSEEEMRWHLDYFAVPAL